MQRYPSLVDALSRIGQQVRSTKDDFESVRRRHIAIRLSVETYVEFCSCFFRIAVYTYAFVAKVTHPLG
jgi:hypothetical protein